MRMRAKRNGKTRAARLQETERGEVRLEGSSQGQKPMAPHAVLIGGMFGAKRPLGKTDRRRRAIIETRAGSREGYYRLRDKNRKI